MTEIINSALQLSSQLDDDLSKARDSLKAIDEGIKSLTGRSAVEFSRFNRGGGRGGGPQRVPYTTRESFDGSFRGGQGEFAGSKRRFSSFGAGRGDEMMDDGGWKRPRMSFDFQEPNYGYQPDPFDDDGPRGPKPTLPSSVTVTQKDTKSRDEAIAELKTNEKRDIAVRNRRMFGVLMGTLQKFKKDEDTKSFKEQEKRQKEIENKLEENKRKERFELQKEKEKLLEKRRRQQAELRRLQRKKALIAATENQMAQLKRLQNFIQTNSKPPIFYMPTKHTIRTIELQKKSQKRLDEMIKRKQEEMEQELKMIDEFNVKFDSDQDEQAGQDSQAPEDQLVGEESELRMKENNNSEEISATGQAVSSSTDVQAEPKTIQDELNELTESGAANYELRFEEDEHQPE